MRPAALMLLAAILAASFAAIFGGAHARAEPPSVATDIPPVHSLVARVMRGVGDPALILPPGASPHGYAMRPSEASTLAGADLVVWIGPALTPWLAHAIGTLAPDARSLALLETDGTALLEFRQGATFEHDDHEAGDLPDGQQAGAKGMASADPEGHAQGVDPHAWLDPENAKTWLGVIAAALAEIDPPNAATYARNAVEARAGIDALAAEISATLAPVRNAPFIVFHDGYRYFEHRFGIEAQGAIAAGDAAPPGPARVSEIRETVARTGAACVFAEPYIAQTLIETVIEGTGAHAATLDPLGTTLPPGPGLYPQLLRDLAAGLQDCLGGP